jgi:LmbE family N-acetylglucosaminyl deacetylase
MCRFAFAVLAALITSLPRAGLSQAPPRTLVAVLAHPDDESPIGPILARYAREGVQVHLIVATDGAEGASNTTIPRGPELARARAEEARCSAAALGAAAPILLGFPDAKLGDFLADPSRLFRLTQRIAEEIARLRPDVVISWGPDGGYGHPDHRLVSDITTQLMRAGAPGMPERLFYMNLTAEAIRVAFPERGAPPLVIPQEKYFTMRVRFTPEDQAAGDRAMACHQTQFPPAMLQRIAPAMARILNGEIALVPATPTNQGTDLFR